MRSIAWWCVCTVVLHILTARAHDGRIILRLRGVVDDSFLLCFGMDCAEVIALSNSCRNLVSCRVYWNINCAISSGNCAMTSRLRAYVGI
ncbi:hypothetical protein FKP32DRAFT_1017824 [Trametes sanguinea]|nr:hypothetical protein FKP32DRAFT_1017824 [Trametes sanguinea]